VCGPLGFDLDNKELARSKIDYWNLLDVTMYPHWGAFERIHGPSVREGGWFFSRHASKLLGKDVRLDASKSPLWLVFGSENSGLHSVSCSSMCVPLSRVVIQCCL
jgi:tRNA(Leu) C34 or U34 (ribose-2'-O)-methylase TrmL